ncbi:isochorismatase family protein [Actinokineospora iranica]|uniref:Nicotinamidase-related amidase n=1 Tax=Actinokineospora iranica TaxID=1271860 RepID=A0A1G6KGN2_9PSEU|nr:isochorismatase family protein [Actinokineospora iranica]SDC30262.1 Nicotinamidase-related amidase [Actinokineospora iranica]
MAEVLLLVDVQRNMLLPPEPVPDADSVGAAVTGLLARARTAGVPVVHVRNNGGVGEPDETGTPGWALVHDVLAGEHVVDKFETDAFLGTSLADLVAEGAAIAVAGMQSEHCVRATTLGALGRGYSVTLAAGAHATYDGATTAAAISREVERELASAGAHVVRHSEVTFGRASARP